MLGLRSLPREVPSHRYNNDAQTQKHPTNFPAHSASPFSVQIRATDSAKRHAPFSRRVEPMQICQITERRRVCHSGHQLIRQIRLEYTFVDDGIWANNPVMIGLTEALTSREDHALPAPYRTPL